MSSRMQGGRQQAVGGPEAAVQEGADGAQHSSAQVVGGCPAPKAKTPLHAASEQTQRLGSGRELQTDCFAAS